MPPHRAGTCPQAALDLADGVQDMLRLLVVDLAVIGERHGPRRPGQQGTAQALLQQLDLAAEQCRRNPQILSRAGKASAFDDAAKGIHDRKFVHALLPEGNIAPTVMVRRHFCNVSLAVFAGSGASRREK